MVMKKSEFHKHVLGERSQISIVDCSSFYSFNSIDGLRSNLKFYCVDV